MRFALATLVLAACSSSYGDASTPGVGAEDAGAVDANDAATADATNDVDLDAGTDAVSEANADAPFDSGPPCNGAAACSRLVFVSSSKGDGAQNGIAGADTECQELANASTKAAGHQFKAWLSANGNFAKDRLAQGTGTYRRVDDMVVATSFSDLLSGALMNGINLDENGNAVGAEKVWTGTHPNGSGSGANCNDWGTAAVGTNGRTGIVGSTTGTWTDNNDVSCNTPLRIYCIEY